MTTFSNLRQESFQGIETLATAFEGLVRNWRFSEEITGDVITPLQASNWVGDTAEAASTTITKVRNELDAAFEEASAIAKALREAHTELAAARADLDAALKRAADHDLTVDADGSAVRWAATTKADQHDPGYADTQRLLVKAVAEDIRKAVARAEAADAAAATALGGATGTDKGAFHASSGPEEQAHRAADLLKLAGNINDAQLDELNKLLKDHGNDPRFTTAFYKEAGPDGFLKLYGQMAVASGDKGGSRPKAIADLQANLGTALATATNSHNVPHLDDAWEEGLRKAGSTRQDVWPASKPGSNPQPYGYQILTNILRTGTYDPHFLLPVAEHVTQLSVGKALWTSDAWNFTDFDQMKLLGAPDGKGGFNPMTGVLEALAHNPDASLEFFKGPATTYNFDGTVKAVHQPNHYLDQLTEAGPKSPLQDVWYDHNQPGGAAEKPGATALGHALEAATTGRAYGSQDPLLPHTKEQAELMAETVKIFGNGEHPHALHPGGSFAGAAPSLGHMAAAYMGDVQGSMSPDNLLLPRYGEPAALDKASTLKMLAAIGRDPDAFGAVANAQQAYTTAHVQDLFRHRGELGPEFDGAVHNAAKAGGEVTGAIAAGRTLGIVGDGKEAAKAYNEGMSSNATWFKSVWAVTGGPWKLTPAGMAITIAAGSGIGEEVKSLIDQTARTYYVDPQYADKATQAQVTAQETAGHAAKVAVVNGAQGSGMNPMQVEALSANASEAVKSGVTDSLALINAAAND
ncbi:DUF6571 family protein [Streptomyces sp. NRRL WC-3742]|uniref:DUF6571 family protein n=1 Tax=Streptomyces sp. NRRL WC-3742 TaxID=1463934 RepID=UPI00068B4574|nr:DUF6571 family protein [Streptomyces sp. NRRL WC-3742]